MQVEGIRNLRQKKWKQKKSTPSLWKGGREAEKKIHSQDKLPTRQQSNLL